MWVILSAMSSRQIVSSMLWQVGSQAVMALFTAVSAKFVAMALSKELAGHYNSVYSFLQIFAILADFGLYAVSVREVSAAKDKARVLGTLMTVRFGVALLALGSAVVIVWSVPAWHGTPLPTGVTIAVFVPFLTLLAGVLRTVFQIQYKMQYVFIAEVLQRVLTLGLMTGLIVYGVRNSHAIPILYFCLSVGPIGAALFLTLSIIYAQRIMPVTPVVDRTLVLSLFRQAVPYGAAFLCIALYRQFDLTLIALLRDDFPYQNATYGFALRVAEMIYLVPTFLLNSTLPVLSERSASGEFTKDLLGRTLLILVTIAGAASLFSWFWSRPIMQVLTTDAYLASAGQAGSDTALSLLALPMFCNAVVLYCFYVLLTRNAWKPLVLTMTVGVILSISLNLLWIPDDGFVGSIHTSSVVQMLLAALLLPQALRVMPVEFRISDLFRISSFLLVLALALAPTGALPITAAASALALLAGTVLTPLLGWIFGLHRIFLAEGVRQEAVPV